MTNLKAPASPSRHTVERRRLLQLLGGAALLAVTPRLAEAAPAPVATEPLIFGSASGTPLTWDIKASSKKIGPGPNLFSGLASDVWVADTVNHKDLHLTVTNHNGRWWSTEVIAQRQLGYGTYRWTVSSNVTNFDKSVVLGLFSWDDAPDQNHREIDVEFSRWANATNPINAQYTVQPYSTTGHQRAFQWAATSVSTHQFTWQPGGVSFASWAGTETTSTAFYNWAYTGAGIPTPGNERTHMNLWLFRGNAPASGNRVDVVLHDFSFMP